MRKLEFNKDVLPHLVAVVVFYLVTVAYFQPVIFSNKDINQHDIQQWEGSSKELRDYRDRTGEEGLWANSMFSGMPAFLINVEWSDHVVRYIKIVGSLGLPHPVRHIFLAFASFYIMLLCFKVKPYLAIPSALAFGLSSYMMIGISAGHNARIGAIAFTPLVVGGFQLVTKSPRKWLGAMLMSLGTALHLRENHLQITYYLLIVLMVYGIILLVEAYREQKLREFAMNLLILAAAGLLALGTYSGKFWTTLEYSKYSMRGPSDLNELVPEEVNKEGLSKSYAFEYSNGIWEPMTLLIPDFFGGASSNVLVNDRESATYRALTQSGDPQMAQQLVNYTSSYWGNQRLSAPYYAGAIMIFLFVLGMLLAESKYRWWLGIIAVFGIVLSWGDSFTTFNYFMFDYFPGYDKFRSVTFALYFPLFAIPLLAAVGLQSVLENGIAKSTRKKFLIALISIGGLCLLVLFFSGLASFTKEGESQLPQWFLSALRDDRQSLMQSDALRSLGFVLAAVMVVYLGALGNLKKSLVIFLLTFLVVIDLYTVSRRYLNEDNFVRSSRSNISAMSDADRSILQDKSDYRVFNIAGNAFTEAGTSYFHQSIGGYHGAKLRRYQELYDWQIQPEIRDLVTALQAGRTNYDSIGVINMLNVKYLKYGTGADQVLLNPAANGPAWMVDNMVSVNSADEELIQTGEIDTKSTAVIDQSNFTIEGGNFGGGIINQVEKTPNYLKYNVQARDRALAVFSEIYYPVGWKATIDGNEVDILRVNYVLRALEIPSGDHVVEFRFEPSSYMTGNKLVMASNVLLGLLLIFSLYKSFRKES